MKSMQFLDAPHNYCASAAALTAVSGRFSPFFPDWDPDFASLVPTFIRPWFLNQLLGYFSWLLQVFSNFYHIYIYKAESVYVC